MQWWSLTGKKNRPGGTSSRWVDVMRDLTETGEWQEVATDRSAWWSATYEPRGKQPSDNLWWQVAMRSWQHPCGQGTEVCVCVCVCQYVCLWLTRTLRHMQYNCYMHTLLVHAHATSFRDTHVCTRKYLQSPKIIYMYSMSRICVLVETNIAGIQLYVSSARWS